MPPYTDTDAPPDTLPLCPGCGVTLTEHDYLDQCRGCEEAHALNVWAEREREDWEEEAGRPGYRGYFVGGFVGR